MRTSFAPLHPGAAAFAGAVAALVLAVVGGFGMMGGWMAGAGGGWMMGRYGGPYGGYGPGYHVGFGGGLLVLVWACVAGAAAGWIAALVYNAVLAGRARDRESGTTTPSGTEVAPR